MYARLGVLEYWLVDLNENTLLRFGEPERGVYTTHRTDGRGAHVAPQLLPECVVSTDDLLL